MATKDILSEGELDALMESVSSGDGPAGDMSPVRDFQPFDFNTREQALLAQMPGLKTISDLQAMELNEQLQALFKVPLEVVASDIQLVNLSKAIGEVEHPSGINIVKVPPISGTSFVVLPGELLSFFVNQYFGGVLGMGAGNASREKLTPTEVRINDVLADKFLSTMRATWRETIEVIPERVSLETNPDIQQSRLTDELAFNFSFAIKVRDWESVISWIVPYAAIEPLRSKLGSPARSQKLEQGGTNWEAFFREKLLSVDLEVSGLFTSRSVSISELLSLKTGSIVPLKKPTEVTICIESLPFISGEHGALNGKKSIKIKEVFGNSADAS
ncbi:MAG: flagellar motor switch protein FliM [Halieaceae bacterium]|jgi:flagellar motor switch protein FliM